MYKALESFATKDYDVRRTQLLEDDFTTQDEIQEFLNIGYIQVWDSSLEITENGIYDVEDYETADVDVAAPQPTLQTKSVTITENGDQTITADTGYDGLSEVDLTVNVSGGAVVLPAGTKFEQSTFTDVDFLQHCDLSNVTNMTYFFLGCRSLKTVSLFDTSSTTNMNYMFQSCENLTTVPQFNTSSVTAVFNMFDSCTKLSDESLNNILAMCANCAVIATNRHLDFLGLTSAQATKCTTLSNWAAAQAAGWTTGY